MFEFNLNEKMSLGQIINNSLTIYKKNFRHFLNISIIFIIPVVILSILNMDTILNLQNTFTNMNAENIDFSAFKSLIPLSYISLIEAILFMFYKLALIKQTDSILNQGDTNFFKSITFVLARFIPIIFTNIIVVLMLVFGYILFIIPGIILTGMIIFVSQAMIIEKKYFFASIDRSFFIIKKHFFEVIIIPVILYCIYFFVLSIFQSVISLLNYGPSVINMIKSGEFNEAPFLTINKWVNYADSFITYLVMIFTTPFIQIAVTLKYHNLRNIKEGREILNSITDSFTDINDEDDE